MKSFRPTVCWALLLVVALLSRPSRGQELPLFDVPTLETNETFRTNFCEQHRRVENGELPLRYALKDLELRPVLFRYQLDKDTGAIAEVDPPIGIKMLDEIARRAQFQWRDSYGVVDSPTANQTWGEVLSWSLDTYDLNGDWYLRTTDRLAEGILFPEKWYDGSLIMVRKLADESDDAFTWLAFLKPFSNGVWGLIIGTTIVSGLVYYAIDYIGCDFDKSKMELTVQESVFQSFLNATGQYIFDPRESGNRLIAVSTCLLFLIVLAAYTANLASFLVIRNSPDLVINDIQDVIKNDLRVCVLSGATSETYMRERYEMARLVEKKTILDSYLGLDNDDCDVVLTTIGTWETNKGSITYNKDCRKEWVGRVVQFNDAGFSLRDSVGLCSSLLRDVISLHLLEMKRDKTYHTIWNTHRAKSVTNNCQEIEDSKNDDFDTIELNLKNVGGIFVLHAIVLVVGLASTLISKHQRNRRARVATPTATRSSTPVPRRSISKKTVGAKTAGLVAAKKTDQDSDHDLSLSEEGGPPPSPVNNNKKLTEYSKLMEYIAAKEKQTESMEAMKKQMDDIQAQLAQLMKERSMEE